MDWYHKLLKKIAHLQTHHAVATILVILAFTIAIYGGVSQVRTVASLENMMPKDVEEIKAFNTLRDNKMGKDSIGILVKIDRDSTDPNAIVDIRDKQVYEYVTEIDRLISHEQDILEVHSIADVINNSNYSQAIKQPQTQEQIKRFIDSEYTSTVLIANTDVGAHDPRMNQLAEKIKQDIDTLGHPNGVEVEITGVPVIQQKLGVLINKDQTSTRWISTLLVFIITIIIFRSFTTASTPIIVVTLSVTWLYGTMGYADLPISTLAGGVAAMVIGIGIDFAIHIINRYKYEREQGCDIKESVEQAVVDTGSALTATSLTTISAFLAFLIGAMPEMGRFGILMAIGISYSLIFSLLGLPALLVLEEELKERGWTIKIGEDK